MRFWPRAPSDQKAPAEAVKCGLLDYPDRRDPSALSESKNKITSPFSNPEENV